MNIKALTLSIVSVAAAVAAANPAQAQEARGARWAFAPNVYKLEQPNLPRGYNQPTPSAVRAGSVPSHNSLGLSPGFLAKAPTPNLIPNQQQIAAAPLPKPPSSPLQPFKDIFGKSISATPQAPMIAQSLPPMSMPSANKAVNASLRKPMSSNSLSGKVRPKARPVAQSARPAALPTVANYGNTGYRPGAFTPVAGSGISTNASVSGTIIRK